MLPHDECCQHCPSGPGMGEDPETEDILTRWPLDEVSNPDLLFPCGWRPDRLCKGWHDKVKARIEELKGSGGR